MDVANKFCGTLMAELLFDVDVNDIVFLITQKFTDWASVTFSKVTPINHLELAPTSLVILDNFKGFWRTFLKIP